MCYLLALASEIPAVLLVSRENTLPSMRRSALLEGCGDDGGVVSDDVALSLENKWESFIYLVAIIRAMVAIFSINRRHIDGFPPQFV